MKKVTSITMLFSVILLIICTSGCINNRQKAYEYFSAGESLKTEGRYKEAIKEYKSAIQNYHNFIEAHIAYQDLMSFTGNTKQLESEYKKMLDSKPNNQYTNFYYGRLADNPETRIEYFKASLKAEPNFLWSINAIGNEYLKQGKTDDAIKQLKKVIEIDSEFAPVHLSLARAWFLNENYEAAESEIKKYLQLRPDNYTGLEVYGMILYAQKQYEKAAVFFEKAALTEPTLTSSKLWLSDVYCLLNRYKNAWDTNEEILCINPSHPAALTMKGMLLSRQNKLTEAKEAIDASLKKEPNSIKTLHVLAEIELKNKNQTAARESYSKIVALKPHDAKALAELGKIEYKNKNIDKSIALLTKAANLNKEDIYSMQIIRDFHSLKGDFETAEYWGKSICSSKMAASDDFLKLGLIQWEINSLRNASTNFENSFNNTYNNICILLLITADLKKQKDIIVSELVRLSSKDKDIYSKKLLKYSAEILAGKYNTFLENHTKNKKLTEHEKILALWLYAKKNNKNKGMSIIKDSATFSPFSKQISAVYESILYADKKTAVKHIKRLNLLSETISHFTVKCLYEKEIARLYNMMGDKKNSRKHQENAIKLGLKEK